MKTKHYVDLDGIYIGAFAGCLPPDGAIEIDSPPSDARQKWDGNKFLPYEKPIQEQIEDLENSITSRNLRGAIAGIQYDIDVINKINAEIAVLALEL